MTPLHCHYGQVPDSDLATGRLPRQYVPLSPLYVWYMPLAVIRSQSGTDIRTRQSAYAAIHSRPIHFTPTPPWAPQGRSGSEPRPPASTSGPVHVPLRFGLFGLSGEPSVRYPTMALTHRGELIKSELAVPHSKLTPPPTPATHPHHPNTFPDHRQGVWGSQAAVAGCWPYLSIGVPMYGGPIQKKKISIGNLTKLLLYGLIELSMNLCLPSSRRSGRLWWPRKTRFKKKKKKFGKKKNDTNIELVLS